MNWRYGCGVKKSVLSSVSKWTRQQNSCHSKFLKGTRKVPSNSLSKPVLTLGVHKMSEKATNNTDMHIQSSLKALYNTGCQQKNLYLEKRCTLQSLFLLLSMIQNCTVAGRLILISQQLDLTSLIEHNLEIQEWTLSFVVVSLSHVVHNNIQSQVLCWPFLFPSFRSVDIYDKRSRCSSLWHLPV